MAKHLFSMAFLLTWLQAYFVTIDKSHEEKILLGGQSYNTPSEQYILKPITKAQFLQAKKHHKHQIHSRKEGVKLYKNGIVLLLDYGKKRIFKNVDTIGDEAIYYHYVGYAPLLKSYVIKATHYDEATFYIVNRFKPHEFETVGIPYISPNKKHIFAYNVLGQDPFTDVELWDVNLEKNTQHLRWQFRFEDLIINDAAYTKQGHLLLKISDAAHYFEHLNGQKPWHYRYVELDFIYLKKLANRLDQSQK